MFCLLHSRDPNMRTQTKATSMRYPSMLKKPPNQGSPWPMGGRSCLPRPYLPFKGPHTAEAKTGS